MLSNMRRFLPACRALQIAEDSPQRPNAQQPLIREEEEKHQKRFPPAPFAAMSLQKLMQASELDKQSQLTIIKYN